MGLKGSGCWYNAPARPFPALVWLEARYPFRVPRRAFARVVDHSTSDGVTPRPFPAKVWWEQRCRIGKSA